MFWFQSFRAPRCRKNMCNRNGKWTQMCDMISWRKVEHLLLLLVLLKDHMSPDISKPSPPSIPNTAAAWRICFHKHDFERCLYILKGASMISTSRTTVFRQVPQHNRYQHSIRQSLHHLSASSKFPLQASACSIIPGHGKAACYFCCCTSTSSSSNIAKLQFEGGGRSRK